MKKNKILTIVQKLVESQVKKEIRQKVLPAFKKMMVTEIKKSQKATRKQVLAELHDMMPSSSGSSSDDPVLNNALKNQNMHDNSRKLTDSINKMASEDEDREIATIKEKIRKAQEMGLNESNNQGTQPNPSGMSFDPSNYGPGNQQHGNMEQQDMGNRVQGVDPDSEMSPRAKKALKNDDQFFNQVTQNAKKISDEAKKKKASGNVNWSP